jgi:phospholipase/carboxylesterase
MILSGPKRPPQSGGKPKSAIIFLHGLGADGENLIGVADFMAAYFPDAVFLAPNAPVPYEGAGYQWFSLYDRNPATILAGVKEAAKHLNAYIDEVMAEYELTESEIALVGFSQGTMIGIFTAIRRPRKIGGIVGFSGALIAPELLKAEAKSKPDICLIHGEADSVVPFTAMAQAVKSLKEHGFNVEDHARPNLQHSIDPEGIEIASKFLKTRLLA